MVFSKKKGSIDGDKRGRAPLPLPTNPARNLSRPRQNVALRGQRREPSSSPRSSSVPRLRYTSSQDSAINSIALTRSSSMIRGRATAYTTKRSGSARRQRALSEASQGVTIPTNIKNANKFVQYREFSAEPLKGMRVVSINEIPAIHNQSDVVVKVKASTVSLKDCYIRRGIWAEKIILPNTPGFELVGSIILMGKTAKEEGQFEVGDAVGAICRTGGNARYVVISSHSLVKIPGTVDSAQAASVITNYMTAYQALHRVKPRGPKETLEGINILVTGGNGPIGQAIIELGFRAGASKIFVTAEKKYHGNLHEQGVCPLPLDAKEWLPLVKGKMDVVVDGICQDGYASPRAALNQTGHLIIIGMTLLMNSMERGWFGTPMDASIQAFATKFMTQTTTYDPYESSKLKPEEWKHDLDYLMRLLERRKLHPTVTKRITLDDVAMAQKEIEAGNVDGLIVCKPWK